MKEHLEPLTDREKDDLVFQITRRILEASYQHIVYNEFLPKILGDKYSDYSLRPETSAYDPSTNPSLKNEFSTFAYRYRIKFKLI